MTLATDIDAWLAEITEPRPEFNNLSPCPFAKSARYSALHCRNIETARECLLGLNIRRSVAILDLPLDLATEAKELCDSLNPDLKERGLWALVSDPSNPIIVKGYRTTQHRHLFIIVQPYEELVKSSAQLEEQGYYQHWDEETLQRVKGSR